MVESAAGWQTVESLAPGMRVQTLDGGLARVLRLTKRTIRPSDDLVLIHLPGGCLDACSDLLLLPGLLPALFGSRLRLGGSRAPPHDGQQRREGSAIAPRRESYQAHAVSLTDCRPGHRWWKA